MKFDTLLESSRPARTRTLPLALIAALGLSPLALAHIGGNNITSQTDGAWQSASTWDLGVPVDGNGDFVQVQNLVSGFDFFVSLNGLDVGTAGGAGTLDFEGVGVDVSFSTVVGRSSTGVIDLLGSSLVSGSLVIGDGGSGEVGVRFGQVGALVSPIIVGDGTSTGLLRVQDQMDTVFAANGMIVGANGTIELVTDSGDTTGAYIGVTGNLELKAGSHFHLSPGTSFPALGTILPIFAYSGTLTGSFTTLSAGGGLTIAQDLSTPGIVAVQVTGVPVECNWDNPGTGSWVTPTNWDSGVAPGSFNLARVNNGGTAEIGAAAADARQLFVGIDGSDGALTAAGGTLDLADWMGVAVTANPTDPSASLTVLDTTASFVATNTAISTVRDLAVGSVISNSEANGSGTLTVR